MLDLLFTRRTTSVTISRSIIRQTACEQCHCAFTYLATTRAIGTSNSWAMASAKKSNAAAREEAENEMAAKLGMATAPAPCPACKHINEELANDDRIYTTKRIGVFAFAFALMGGVILYYAPHTTGWIATIPMFFFAAAGLVVLLAVANFLFRSRLLARDYFTSKALIKYHVKAVAVPIEKAPSVSPSQKILATCACGAAFSVDANRAGKRGKCLKCGNIFAVPSV